MGWCSAQTWEDVMLGRDGSQELLNPRTSVAVVAKRPEGREARGARREVKVQNAECKVRNEVRVGREESGEGLGVIPGT